MVLVLVPSMEAKNFCILCFICFYFLLQVWWWYPIDYSSNGCVVHILGKKPWWVFLTAAVPQMTTCDHLSRGVFASIHWQSAVSIAGFWLFFLSVRHWCDSTAECQPPCETLSVTRCRNEELGRGGGGTSAATANKSWQNKTRPTSKRFTQKNTTG